MLNFKNNKFSRTRVFILFVLFAVIMLVTMFVFFTIYGSLKDSIESTILKEMQSYTEETAVRMSRCKSVDEAVKEIDEMRSDGSHWWFVVKDESLVFQKDYSYTEQLVAHGDNIKKIVSDYKDKGGNANELDYYLEQIYSGQNFSMIIKRENGLGDEFVAVAFADIEDSSCAFGYSIRKSYLLSKTNFTSNIITIQVLLLLLCVVIFIIGGVFSVKVYSMQKKIYKLEEQLTLKNRQIVSRADIELTGNKSSKITDIITGLYTKPFLLELLAEIDTENVESLGYAEINVEFISDDLNKRLDDISKFAEILIENSTDSELCCAVSDKKYIVLFANDKKEKIIKYIQTVKKNMSDISSISFDFTEHYCDNRDELKEFIFKLTEEIK